MIRVSLSKVSDFIHNLPRKLSRKSFFELNKKKDQNFVFDVIKTKNIPSAKQIKYIKKFYSDAEILATKIAFFFILASSIILSTVLYKNYITVQPSIGGEYAEAVIGAPTYINPLFAQTNDIDQDLSRLIFSSLMQINEQGHLVGDLVQNYEIDEEQTTYTLYLKPNIKWHNQEPLTADDVVFTVQSIQDQNFKSPLYVTFRNVQIRKIDDRTVSFTLAEPFAPFLSVLTFGILPEHLWFDIDPNHAILAELNLKPIGSGPYKFDSLTKDKKGNIREYALSRFNDYYSDGPFIKKINLKFFGTFEEAIAGLAEKNVDGIGFLPRDKTSGILESKEQDAMQAQQAHKFSLPQYTALFFNKESRASLKELEVRQAIGLAISKRQIIDTVFPSSAEPADTPILAGMIGYTEDLSTILYDPAQAEKILDDAGWKRVYESNGDNDDDENSEEQEKNITSGSENLGLEQEDKEIYTRKKQDKLLEVTLTTIQKDEMIRIAEIIRSLLQDIGIKVNLQIVEVGKIQKEVIKPRAYEILLFGQILGKDPDPYPFWHSSQANDPGLNLALYANKEVDRLLEDARRTPNTQERQEKYVQFQEKVIQDMPAIFLYSLQYTYIVPDKIKGITTQRITHPSDRFSNIENWYIKTKKHIEF